MRIAIGRRLALVALAACVHTSGPTVSVVPGLAVKLNVSRGPDTVVYRRSITRAGRDSVTGTRTVVMRVVAGQDRTRLLEVAQRFPGGGGMIVDTALAELSNARAVGHRSHQPTRTMSFDFDSSAATGSVTISPASPDSAPRLERVRQNLGGPIFDSNIIEMVVAGLPLATNFTTELPFFIYERGGRVPMRVAVQERAVVQFPALGSREAWLVSVDVPGAPATVWVDARTRDVLRVRYDLRAQGMAFTDDRTTPLPPRHG
ncbi:MAG TPA: hypothetical protein VNS10_10280 [Gemmatimonadaceae bacterium]|jgi:hypothetical protein|nr:hypothetical protein [Gemmatimonadaceae bacterium]